MSATTPDVDGRTVVELLTALGGLMLDPTVGGFHASSFAARVPLAVLGDLGIAHNAIRTALTRQVQRGLLKSEKCGRQVEYTFTDAGQRMVSEAGLRVRGDRPFASTSTIWTLVSFSVPESRRELRSKLRIHLSQMGFRALRDGLWVALDGLAADLVMHDLDDDVRNTAQLDVFIATPVMSDRLSELVRQTWDVERLRERHQHFLNRWERVKPARSHALPALTQFSADWVDLLRHDPGLPADQLPQDWPGDRSAKTAARLFSSLQSRAGADLAALIDPCDRIR